MITRALKSMYIEKPISFWTTIQHRVQQRLGDPSLSPAEQPFIITVNFDMVKGKIIP